MIHRPGCGLSMVMIGCLLAGCGEPAAATSSNVGTSNRGGSGPSATTSYPGGSDSSDDPNVAGDTASSTTSAAGGTLGLAGASSSVVNETTLIDNADDGNETNELSGKWLTYDDSWDKGKSTVTPTEWSQGIPFAMSAPGYGSVGYAAKIAGTTDPTLNFAYIGMMVTLGPNSLCPDPEPPSVTLASYQALRFKTKGHFTGGKWVLIVSHRKDGIVDNCSNPIIGDTLTAWGDYRFDFTSQITEEWSIININLRKDLFLPSWGKHADLELVLQRAKDITWQYENGSGGTTELWVDDVELVR